MTRRALTALASVAILLTVSAGAAEPPTARDAFDRLKSLAGSWEGTGESSGVEPFPTAVQYRVAAGGSAVFETLFPGTEHEMISVYHVSGDDLVMTHYCAMGNQPHMRLDRAASSAAELRFAFDGGTGFDPAVDGHIHSGRIAFREDGRIEAGWDVFKGGKQVATHRFVVARKG